MIECPECKEVMLQQRHPFSDMWECTQCHAEVQIKVDIVNEYLRKTLRWIESSSKAYRPFQKVRPRVHCKDGFNMSVQASQTHYCTPREDAQSEYTQVEIGFPSEKVPEFMPYVEDEDNPTETVYGWVPVETVNEVIRQHGGLVTITTTEEEY